MSLNNKAVPIKVGSEDREQQIQNRIAFLLNQDMIKERNRHLEVVTQKIIEMKKAGFTKKEISDYVKRITGK